MVNFDAYRNLLNKISIIEKLNKLEKEKANNKLNSKINDIVELRNFIEENCKEYTDISYFFVIYFIIATSMLEVNYTDDFKNYKDFQTIKEILQDSSIKIDLDNIDNDNEYIEKYKKDYELLINGLNVNKKDLKSNLNIAIEKFWNIFKE